MKLESILDKPQSELDNLVWDKQEYGSYKLSDSARIKIRKIIGWIIETFDIDYFGANITGSITSNQYQEDSDIDLHITSPSITEDNQELMNRQLRQKYENEFKIRHENDAYIGNHPIEVYFQINQHQDMMSVGCYDVIANEWRLGPKIEEEIYDPYEEYYEDDMKFINNVVKEIRNIILECYEICLVLNNSSDKDFKLEMFETLKERLLYASDVFDKAKNSRKVMSAPESDEEALRMRDSREWHIADSAFKLMDKFGYLKILKEFQLCYDGIVNDNMSYDVIVRRIIDVIQDNLAVNMEVNDEDREEFQKVLDESVKDLSIYAIISGMLAIPGITNAASFEQDLSKLSDKEFNISSSAVKKAFNDASKENKKYGDLSFSNLTNLIATIIYNEAMIDYKNYKDVNSLIAIGNVINNRAGGDAEKFANVITKPSQFYSAKHIIGGTTDDDYILYYPYGGNIKCWKLCNEIAVRLINGTLKNVIGNRNMIANKKLDNPDDFEKWGKDADLKIGSHTFGYDKSQDGFRGKRIAKTSTPSSKPSTYYTVKKGDNLSKIALRYKTTVKDILKKNPKIANADNIKVGLKLAV